MELVVVQRNRVLSSVYPGIALAVSIIRAFNDPRPIVGIAVWCTIEAPCVGAVSTIYIYIYIYIYTHTPYRDTPIHS